MAKIELDKYYTPKDLAEYCVNKTKEIIGEENIIEWLEPSAGCGNFLDYLGDNYLAYDISPEDDRIVEQDYLTLDLEYKKGRCIIGNPPYGNKNNLTVSFYKKSIQIGDYIAFILPISQYKNNIKLYEFDLLYSENLGRRQYSNKTVHCCLNIYKRPKHNLNKKPSYKLKDVEIKESIKNSNPKRNKTVNHTDFNYDIRIKAWGGNTGTKSQVGHEVDYPNQYPKEFCIKIHNEKFKEQVINLIRNAVWEEIYPMTGTPNILQWQVYKYIKEQIPEIE